MPKKILCIADDIRLNTGVGIQARKLLKGLVKTGKYEVVEVGCALNHRDTTPVMDDGVLIYPLNIQREYGDRNSIRYIISKEKPDYIVPFGDPRFFGYLFQMDDEIRQHSKILFYHTWDNDPFPKFNLPFYDSCDALVMISKFSYDLIKPNVKTPTYLVQHGYDPTEFFPLPDTDVEKERENIKKMVNLQNLDFIVFWNNRNISRKRPGDVLMAFKEFQKTHPNSLLFMNTDPIDMEGIDILQFQRDLNFEGVPIIYNFSRIPSSKLNLFYNIADVTLTITHSEGFGLCVGESLCAGTPVIATKTGGMTEQMSYIKETDNLKIPKEHVREFDTEVVFGQLMEPKVRNLYGVPGASYIYQDYVSQAQVVEALNNAYENRKKLKEIGKQAREFIIQNLHTDKVIQKWDEVLTEIDSTPSTYKKIKTFTI